MDVQNKNLILATALSFIVILVWFVLFPPPEPDPVTPSTPNAVTEGSTPTADTPSAPAGTAVTAAVGTDTQDAALTDAPRVPIETPRLIG